VNVQLRLTENGSRIFEMNPRFSSTVFMRHLLGFRDLVWMVEDAAEAPVEFVQPAPGESVVRVQGAMRLKDGGHEL
jgi:carbamoyl-phosphate synthase large subunit